MNNSSVNDKIRELREDYEAVSWASLKEKKEFAAKYNSASSKAKDIEKAIIAEIKVLRSQKTEFDIEDYRDFIRQDVGERNFDKFLETEPLKFIELVRDICEKNYKKNGMTLNGKMYLKRYDKCLQVISQLSKTDEEKNIEKVKEDNVQALIIKFSEELKEFKKNYLDRIREYASERYDKIPGNIERFNNQISEKEEEYKNERTRSSYNSLEKLINKRNALRSLILKYPTKESYVNHIVEESEKDFENNVRCLSERVNDKEFIIENIKVSNVKEDPKIFEMMISDGNKKLYCRSIIAAEYSDKMIPHYRFIMTDRK